MRREHSGFTLLEIMMVLVVLGIMFSAVIPNIRGTDPGDELQKHSHAFVQKFTLASEFALLNNLELGLHIEQNTYQFLAFDGRRWVPVPDQDILKPVTLAEPMSIELSLDDLPIEDNVMGIEQSMFNDLLDEDIQDEDIQDEEKPIYPQVFILSGGDITPFKLTFVYDNDFIEAVYIEVQSSYTLPLSVSGPHNVQS